MDVGVFEDEIGDGEHQAVEQEEQHHGPVGTALRLSELRKSERRGQSTGRKSSDNPFKLDFQTTYT